MTNGVMTYISIFQMSLAAGAAAGRVLRLGQQPGAGVPGVGGGSTHREPGRAAQCQLGPSVNLIVLW